MQNVEGKEFMLSNIIGALSNTEFSSDIYFSLDEIQIDDDKLILTIQVTYEDDDEKLQVWQVTCEDFKDHKLNVNYFEEFEVLDEHVLLWEYNSNSANLFFKGQCNEIIQVIGDLFLSNSNIVDGQIHLEKYLNITSLLKNSIKRLEMIYPNSHRITIREKQNEHMVELQITL